MSEHATTPAAPASRLRNALRTAALMFVSILIALAGLEIIVRAIEPKEVMRYFFMSSDPVLHHRFTPGASGRYKTTEFDVAYHINSLGLRSPETTLRKPEGTSRILLLGDSFTEGDGVEYQETFAYRLQHMVDSAGLGRRWEVINAGVGSYAPMVEYLYLVNGGLALEPDIVVLNLDLSDFFDDLGYAAHARLDARGVPLAAGVEEEKPPDSWLAAGLVNIKDFFKEHTRLYNFVRLRIDRYLEGARHNVDMSGNLHYDKYAMFRDGSRVVLERDGALTFKHLLLIRDTLAARGIAFHINLYPYGIQVSPREWNAGREFWGFRPDTVYGTGPQQEIERWAKRQAISVSNLCDAFLGMDKSLYPVYHDYNGHWRPVGHEVVARKLYEVMLPRLREKHEQ